MQVNVTMELDSLQAFDMLLQTLNVSLDDEPPKFSVNDLGEIVCDKDDRGELYLALYHLSTKLCPNTEFRHLFENPNKLMCQLYKESEAKYNE